MAASGGLYSSATGGKLSRPAVAEFVGTFVLVFVGCSVAVAAALERPVAGAFGGDDAKGGEANQAEPQQAAAEDVGDSGEDFGFDEA